jgi:hypothetical protein
MKIKLLSLLVLLFAGTLSTFAQNRSNITVSGRVIEGDTKQPAIQANVQMLSLPDSTFVTGIATTANGDFTLPAVRAGKYVLKVSYIGYKTHSLPLQLSASSPTRNVGSITLQTDAVLLSEATVTAEAPQVQVVEDTIAFSATAYRTPQGAMLEELVKKLPGAEIDDDGNIKINGKDIKKIMVDGKEFFGGDVKTGLKNLPVDMIDKLKTYDKQSDMARITGIDDGEEETVLDLTVKKGMNQGWFGNADAAVGTKSRYMARAMVNRFVDQKQASVIASANNTNDRGFSGGGGPPSWRRGNGLNAPKVLGINFATETPKLELGGSLRYNHNNSDVKTIGSVANFTNQGFYTNTNQNQMNRNSSLNANFRLEWKPDTMTNIIFRPNFSYSKTDNNSTSFKGTFNGDPLDLVANPNDYLDFDDIASDDPLSSIRANTSNQGNISDNYSVSGSATLQVNRRLNSRGRNLTLEVEGSFGNGHNRQYSEALTQYYLENRGDTLNRFTNTKSPNHRYEIELAYSEPLTRTTFLQFRYEFEYSRTKSDKRMYDLYATDPDWTLSNILPPNYEHNLLPDLSKYAKYDNYNHQASVSLLFTKPKYRLSVGVDFRPQRTVLEYKKGDIDTTVVRNVFNFAPSVDFRYRFSKVSQLRFRYRGRPSLPSMENLLDIPDDTDPTNIRYGNSGLKPSFTHNANLFYNNYNAEKQQSFFAHANFSATQNAVTTVQEYNAEKGGLISKPQNINGNWNVFGMFGFNTALKNKKFTIGTFSNASYVNNMTYLNTGTTEVPIETKNRATTLALSERANFTFRNSWLEVGVNGSFSYNFEKNELKPTQNQEPYNFSYGANAQVTMPWQMTLSTNIRNQSRRGYSDASMNNNELIWNAQLSQTFLKGAATVSVEAYDILKRQSNLSRSFSATSRNITEYNAINSYLMVHFVYRLNIFGSKAARDRIQQGGFGRPGGFGGGFGGRRF